ncbi:hypothetical protein ACOMHN_049950 [Nucella lapillus]
MKEGNQIASPVFKKRFARRQTTQRPFTFAHNFETEQPLPGAKSPIVSQVGDRGVVITSPVQLSRGPEGPLTISDIVRQSPVPVLIAHATPGENEREPQSDDNDEDEAITSLLRRSMRFRVRSQQFLSRQQHPHGRPQLSKSQCTPDESYIGSQNASNIDAEVSIVDEEGQTRGGRGRKGSSASSSKSPKQKAKTQTRSKPTDPPTSSARGKAQTRETSQREGSSSSVKDASAAKKSSGRRGASTSAKTSSSRKGRERGSLDRTPPPPQPPSAQKERRNLSDKGKKVPPSPLSKRNKRENVLNSSGSQKTKNAAPQTSVSSLSHKRAPSNADSKSPRRGVTSRVVGERSSHRATPPRASRSSSSFWKTSCPADSTPRTKRKQPAMSQSSLYEDHSLGGREMNRSVAVICQIPAKKASSSTSRDHRKSDQRSEEEDEEPKRPRSGVTELGVIISILEDTEDDIMEDSAMPEMCQRAVHKAFSFTKRQLQETESQLKEISEAEYQINKLKSTCKTMSGDSKEKLQEKFILQKELQSLKSQGIDADMMHIDQWLQDFQALRLSSN